MEEKLKKKAAASAVAAVTAAGVIVGGAFASPGDIMDMDQTGFTDSGTVLSQSEDDGGADSGSEDGEEEKLRGGISSRVRSIAAQSPKAVRAVLFVPLWFAGTVVIALATALWTAVLSPVAAKLVLWLCIAAIALAVFALGVKTVFPDLPLKKILRKKTVLTVIGIVLAFGLLDSVLPYAWEGYEDISGLIHFGAYTLAVLVPLTFVLSRVSGKREALSAEQERKRKQDETRELVNELADSVCRKR